MSNRQSQVLKELMEITKYIKTYMIVSLMLLHKNMIKG